MNLLIGGTGFIGTALATHLTKRGESVVSLSRSGVGAVSGVAYRQFDLATDTLPLPLVQSATHVFILTGQKKTGELFDAEGERAMHRRLLTSLADGTGRVFLASSILIYGQTRTPASEGLPGHPLNSYERFKLDCEREAARIIPADRLTVFRIATLYGPSKRDGFVARALAASDVDPLVLAGNGQIERDFLFLDDAVRAMLTVRDAADPSGTVNIASGESVTLTHVVAELGHVLGRSIPSVRISEPGSGPARLRTSNERLRQHFGFTVFTSLADGLARTAATYATEREGKRV